MSFGSIAGLTYGFVLTFDQLMDMTDGQLCNTDEGLDAVLQFVSLDQESRQGLVGHTIATTELNEPAVEVTVPTEISTRASLVVKFLDDVRDHIKVYADENYPEIYTTFAQKLIDYAKDEAKWGLLLDVTSY